MTADYFNELGAALSTAGCFRPTLVIDLDRLDANIERVRIRWPASARLRLVDKSLACLPLLDHLMQRLGTQSVMTFHLPITRRVLAAFAEADLLFGKPMPAQALSHLFDTAPSEEGRAFSERVVHLVDSPARLGAYAAIAKKTGLPMRIAFEIDVGLHRGGFANPNDMQAVLAAITQAPLLRLEGLMGYEAHVPAVPDLVGGAAGERTKVDARFEAFAALLPHTSRRILNSGGSHTALTFGAGGATNDLSMGSGFLLPTDFERDLQDLEPAAFIATPILKIVDARVPGPAWLTRVVQRLGRLPRRGCFLYGGKWLARPVYPEGLRENPLWGTSSNQQFMELAASSTAKEGDFAFLRPTQSEAILQQFGPIALLRSGTITGFWDPLPVG